MSWYDNIPVVSGIVRSVDNLGSAPPTTFTDRDQIQNYINQGMQQRTNTAAPQLAMGPQDQFRQGQLQQVGQLQQIAGGQQAGAGELAVQRQVAQQQAQQQAIARMARGGNAGLAYRNAADASAGIGLQGAGLAQQSAINDQWGAQQALGQALNAGRGADINIAGQNANNQLQQQAMNNQMYAQLLSQLGGMNQAELQARLGGYQTQQQVGGGILSALGGAGAAAAMASDERLKTDITDARDEIDEMLDNALPRAFTYKEPERWGKGRRFGIMAQDLERSAAGREIVHDTPDGKLLDTNALISASIAGLGRLNQRLREIERRA